MADEFQHDVFLSYSRQDQPWADRLTNALTGRGLDVFQDTTRLVLGDEWEPQLADALKASRHLVFLWSKHANASKWVTCERFFFRYQTNPTAAEQGSFDRLMIPLVLEEPPSPGDSLQKLSDPTLIAAYPQGPGHIADSDWDRVVDRLAATIGEASPERAVPLAILAMTDTELAGLTPTTRNPFGRHDLDTFLATLRLNNLATLQAKPWYGATRGDWKPFGGTGMIWDLLVRIKTELNSRNTFPSKFRWMPIGDAFWHGSGDEMIAEASKLVTQRPSVIVIDPISLFATQVWSRLALLKDCFKHPDCLILALTPFAPNAEGTFLRDELWELGAPYLTTYGGKDVPIEAPFASCFINLGDDAEVRRLLRLGLEVQTYPGAPDRGGRIHLGGIAMIFTFYSYKGGVGRSMALANVADWFSRQGLRVVMIDWDLEAPGLENFFFDRTTDARTLELIQGQPGLVDMLGAYKQEFSGLPLPEKRKAVEAAVASLQEKTQVLPEVATAPRPRGELVREIVNVLGEHLPPLKTLLYPIRRPDPSGASDGQPGPLWLLTAGWRAGDRFASYAERVQTFDWTDFYISYHGEAYFEWLREQLEAQADVVLIDSRTGVTEMGGVCTRQLADVVVSFCATNEQNLGGIAEMARSFRGAVTRGARAGVGRGPVEVLVIPARVDDRAEVRDLNKFKDRFKQVAKALQETESGGTGDPASSQSPSQRRVDGFSWDLKIPYVSKYSYRERLIMDPQDPDAAEDIVNAYKILAAHLVRLGPEGGTLQTQFAAELQRVFGRILPRVAILSSSVPDDRREAEALRQRLTSEGISVWDDPLAQGGDFGPQVLRMIDQAEHVVLVATPGSPASQGLREQWRYARQQGRSITIVGSAPVELPFWMRGTTALDPSRDWPALVRRLSAPGLTARVPQLAPPTPVPFIERRQEGGRLRSALLAFAPARDGARRSVLTGPAGCGKTALAAWACNGDEVAASFPDGILWASLGPNPEDHLAQLGRLYAALTGNSPGFADRGEAADRLAEKLASRRCLMVVDDVWDAKHLRPFLQGGEQCTRLISTRDRSLAGSIGAAAIEVGPMTPAEAAAMCAASFGLHADDPAIAELAKALDGWPLAIHLAAMTLTRLLGQTDARIASASSAPESLLSNGEGRRSATPELRAAIQNLTASLRTRGIVAFDQVGTTERNQSVSKSLELSIRLLRPDELALYQRLSTVPADLPVPLAEVARHWNRVSKGETLLEVVLSHLTNLSLLRYDEDAQEVQVPGFLHAYLSAPQAEGRRETPPRAVEGQESEEVERAKRILRGEAATSEDILVLAKRLMSQKAVGFARRLLALAERAPDLKDPDLRLKLAQQFALATYKDPDLIAAERFDRAREILNAADELAKSRNQETLGLAGAIFKRKWEVSGRKEDLERSVAYYLRGFREGSDRDQGYTGINAAFTLDLLAHQEAREALEAGDRSESAEGRRGQARRIREELIRVLPGLSKRPGFEWLEQQWWFFATVAEAYFGLGRYEEATYWLKQATNLEVADWEYETTARQLAALAGLRDGAGLKEGSPAREVLSAFLSGNERALESVVRGKVGLALSGGGFRASLFHIGVLARLAELDVLRSVEVLSCVSGGSIIGAYYYLEVRKLLQSKPDAEITREDYIAIVKRIERDFLAGVQRNIRVRATASFLAELKILLASDFSRTKYIGRLLETELYARVDDGEKERWLNRLRIEPAGGPADFNPKSDNWRRLAKVPILVLNATTLNTGHNWQFTASWMGEPPSGIDVEVDSNDRLRRMYYEEAPWGYREFRLGDAVVASACVPGLFEPLAMRGLYPERTVRLVDGGVHDNQGIAGLLDQDCTVALVSDASGQMQNLNDPCAEFFAVPLRTNNMLMARIRAAQFDDLLDRRRATLLRGLMFVHLKKGLGVEPVDWKDCKDPHDAFDVPRRTAYTAYGVLKGVQSRLAGIRTDLDSFSDQEAYALMLSGYRMTKYEFPRGVPGFPEASGAEEWNFLAIDKVMGEAKGFEAAHRDFLRLLDVAGNLFFKLFRLSPELAVTTLIVVLILLAVIWSTASFLFRLADRAWDSHLSQSLGSLGQGLAGTLIVLAFWYFFVYVWLGRVWGVDKYQKSWTRIITGPAILPFGWILSRFCLLTYDRWYLNRGRMAPANPAGASDQRSGRAASTPIG